MEEQKSMRITKFEPIVNEIRKYRPDLRFVNNQEALRILIQERTAEILTEQQRNQQNKNNKNGTSGICTFITNPLLTNEKAKSST